MNILIGTVVIWGAALWLLRRHLAKTPQDWLAIRDRSMDLFLYLLPRIAVGLIGAGFLAEMLPEELVAAHFGTDAGLWGMILATFFGAITPGGPFVAFAIGAAALKAGASIGMLTAYITAWCVICMNRSLAYELPLMGAGFLWPRIALGLPLPFVLGELVGLLGY
ncbi:MAG: hypothetical protein ACPGNV_04965 [Mangrovicoccus sp.]